jgi:hypothetical protein
MLTTSKQLILTDPPAGLDIISGSLATVCRGNVESAKVATIGTISSKYDFIDKAGKLLEGEKQRLATFSSLGISSAAELNAQHADQIYHSCLNYFRNDDIHPTYKYLDNYVLNPLGFSYFDNTACHLDIVPWVTTKGWNRLKENEKYALLGYGIYHLMEQLCSHNIETIMVNSYRTANYLHSFIIESPTTGEKVCLFESQMPKKLHTLGQSQECWVIHSQYDMPLFNKQINCINWTSDIRYTSRMNKDMREGLRDWLRSNR